jgi:hypothetical protein
LLGYLKNEESALSTEEFTVSQIPKPPKAALSVKKAPSPQEIAAGGWPDARKPLKRRFHGFELGNRACPRP